MKKITYLKETFSDYGSFEGEFREVFDTENNVFIESTCARRQDLSCEEHMSKYLDDTSLQKPSVIVFLTVKNLLAESTI